MKLKLGKKQKNNRNKIEVNKLSSVFLIVLVLTTSVYLLLIIHFLRPNYDMIFQSTEEKMETAYDDKMELLGREGHLYQVLNFIKNTVERDSTVLFLNGSYWLYGKPYFYPEIICDFVIYESDQQVFDHLKENLIDYLIIINDPQHLSSYENIFSKIEYNSLIYLLQVNRSAL